MLRVSAVVCNRNGFWYYVTQRFVKCGPWVRVALLQVHCGQKFDFSSTKQKYTNLDV